MQIGERRQDGIVILTPAGRIDNDSSDDFQARLLAAAASDTTGCILDFSAVPYITSSGLRAVLAGMRALQGRRMAIAGLNTVVGDIFKVTRFAQVIPTYTTIDDAAAALSAPQQGG